MKKLFLVNSLLLLSALVECQELFGTSQKPQKTNNDDDVVVRINFDGDEDDEKASDASVAMLTSMLSKTSITIVKPKEEKIITFNEKTKDLKAFTPTHIAQFNPFYEGDFPNIESYLVGKGFSGIPYIDYYQELNKAKTLKEILPIITKYKNQYVKTNHRWGDEDLIKPRLYGALKFQISQHKDMQQLLLSTGDNTLVYQSDDNLVGCGTDGKGKNYLGVNLMRIRGEIAQDYWSPAAKPTDEDEKKS